MTKDDCVIMYKRDILTDYLEEIKNTIEYQIWFLDIIMIIRK